LFLESLDDKRQFKVVESDFVEELGSGCLEEEVVLRGFGEEEEVA